MGTPTNIHIPSLASLQAQQGKVTLFWFRRDLRLQDNHALYQALKHEKDVLPLFIFDKTWVDELADRRDARVSFVHDAVSQLHQKLTKLDSSLLVCYGDVLAIFKTLLATDKIKAVYTNKDYDPKPIAQMGAISDLLGEKAIPFYTYKDHVIFEHKEVIKKDGLPYTVFTPYMRKWKALYQPACSAPYPTAKYFAHLLRTSTPWPLVSLAEMGMQPTQQTFPPCVINRDKVRQHLLERNNLMTAHATHIGVHLRYGTLSIREAVRIGYEERESWLESLIWRDFFMMILANFPHVAQGPFRQSYAYVPWRHDEEGFAAWCEGRTGFPIVDAGMRQLNRTGFMHNRARLITASFLVKLLLIDWRWGEAYFAEKLLDHELALNNGNWQWVAGCGCDFVPYFRILSPDRQTLRFDPQHHYIKKWVPEYTSPSYPQPIVDYTMARQRALKAYQQRLSFGQKHGT